MSRSACAWRAGHGETGGGESGGTEAGGREEKPTAIAIAPATACIFRREVLERLNGFDERFVSYLEDVDLGLRCVREGIGGLYVPDAVAWHHGSATLGRWNARVVRLISRNQVLLVARHYDRALLRSWLWPDSSGAITVGVGGSAAWRGIGLGGR